MSVFGMLLAVGLLQAVSETSSSVDLQRHLDAVCPDYEPVVFRESVSLSGVVSRAIDRGDVERTRDANARQVDRLTDLLAQTEWSLEDRAALLRARGTALAALENYAAAEPDFEASLALGALAAGESQIALLSLGVLRWVQDREEEAVTPLYRMVCSARPQPPSENRASIVLNVLSELGRHEESRIWARHLLQTGSLEIARLAYNRLLSDSGGHWVSPEAIALSYEMVVRWPEDRSFWRNYVLSLSFNGHHELALQVAEQMQARGMITEASDWRLLWGMRVGAGRDLDQTVRDLHSRMVEDGLPLSSHDLNTLYSTAASMDPLDSSITPDLRQRMALLTELAERDVLFSERRPEVWWFEGLEYGYEAIRQLAALQEHIGELEDARRSWHILALSRGGGWDRFNVARLSLALGEDEEALNWLVWVLRNWGADGRQEAWALFADLAGMRGQEEVARLARMHAAQFHPHATRIWPRLHHEACHVGSVREIRIRRAISRVHGTDPLDETWYIPSTLDGLCDSRPPLNEISLASEPDCEACSGDMLDLFWEIRQRECSQLETQRVNYPEIYSEIAEYCVGLYDADGNFQLDAIRPNSPPNDHN